MKMILKSMHLEFFRGVQDKTYNFSNPITRIKSENGRGKTTIADAFMWVFFDKSYSLVSNPNIRPLNVEECTPKVSIVLEIDGVEVSVCKIQNCKVTKSDVDGVKKVSLNNTYEVNSVPLGERDFKLKMEDYGVDVSTAIACVHPSLFTSQKVKEMREMLFKMTSEKTDLEIAKMSESTKDVANLLESYSLEEITAMNKASKKKAAEQCGSIPDQIIGLEKAKIDIDVSELELHKNMLEEKIKSCEEKIKSGSNVLDELKQKKFSLQFEINDCKRRANESIIKKRSDLENKIFIANNNFNEIHQNIARTEHEIEEKKNRIDSLEKERSELGEQYKNKMSETFDDSMYVFDESEWKFDESSTVCSLCGQTLPEETVNKLKVSFEEKKIAEKERIEQLKTSKKEYFNQKKDSELTAIKNKGFEKKNEIEALKEKISIMEKELPELRQSEIYVNGEKNKYTSELSEIQENADMDSDEEYIALIKQDAELDEKINNEKQNGANTEEIELEKDTYENELDSVKERIAQSANNTRIDEQILELQNQQRNYEQSKADAEKILNQIDQVSKKKNEFLVEEINKHFGYVTWKLFDYQKNGEYKEVCIPMIDGFRFGESTNTGRDIVAKLDICNSLQKFFGTNYPIFLDNAESLNDFNVPKMDCQLITLRVAEPIYEYEIEEYVYADEETGEMRSEIRYVLDDNGNRKISKVIYDGSLKTEEF